MFKYWAFGLTIKSEIEFPELIEFDFIDAPDLKISLGVTINKLEKKDSVHSLGISMNSKEYLLRIKDVAFYYVSNGKDVIVERQKGSDDKTIRLFLLSNVIAAVLHQRNAIPLHASAVFHENGIALFCGDSGAGKSTTIIALKKKGYKIFSDDICVLKSTSFLKGYMYAWPSYPIIKLWENSYKVIDEPLSENEYQLRADIPKYARFYHNDFSREPQRINHIFILETNEELNNPKEVNLNPGAAFEALVNKTYRPEQISGMNKRNVNFTLLSQLAASVSVSKITRPIDLNSIDKITQIVDERLNSFVENNTI